MCTQGGHRIPFVRVPMFAPESETHTHFLRPPGLHASRSLKLITHVAPWMTHTRPSGGSPTMPRAPLKSPPYGAALHEPPTVCTWQRPPAQGPIATATCSHTYRRPVPCRVPQTALDSHSRRTEQAQYLHASASEQHNLKIIHRTLHMHTTYANTFGLQTSATNTPSNQVARVQHVFAQRKHTPLHPTTTTRTTATTILRPP